MYNWIWGPVRPEAGAGASLVLVTPSPPLVGVTDRLGGWDGYGKCNTMTFGLQAEAGGVLNAAGLRYSA